MDSSAPLFLGSRSDCLAWLKCRPRWYVYVLRRPNGRPFYVGKGTGLRVFAHENEATHPNDRRSNAHKLNVIRSILRTGKPISYEVHSSFDTEADAYEMEEALIREYGRLHEKGPLTNRAAGGGSPSGASPFSRKKHAVTLGGIPTDDPETATLNRFVLGIGKMRSVVLKPLSRFRPRPTETFMKNSREPTARQAIALAASAAANGIPLLTTARIPRTVVIDDVAAFVENGVSRDIVTSGMAAIYPAMRPEEEVFILDERQTKAVVGFIGVQKATELGLVNA